jgi:hypothetical protein
VGRVLKAPEASLKWVKKPVGFSEKGFGQQPRDFKFLELIDMKTEAFFKLTSERHSPNVSHLKN